MFCKSCGVHLHADAKFCHQCGADNSRKRSLKEEPVQAKRAPQELPGLSFETFREAKGKERASGFKSKKTKLGKSQLQAEVNVQVGVMQLKDGFLRIVRDSCLPLKVSPSVGATELLTKARDKIVRFNRNVFAARELVKLIYPDRTEVANLPGSIEPFILQWYKEELGKPYSRIYFYLTKTSDFIKHTSDFITNMINEACSPAEDEEDNDIEELLNSPFDVIVENAPPKPSSSNLEPTASTSGCSNDEIQDGPGALETTLLQAAQIEDPPQAKTIQNFNEGAAILDVHSISLDTSEFKIKAVKIHRSTLRQDMLELFRNDDILKCNLDVAFIGHNGQEEIGRGQGVLREALTSFWKGFSNALSVGAQCKVPAIRHDYQRKEWEAVARILVFGYMKEQYFPLLV
eukprot:gene13127-14477_t